MIDPTAAPPQPKADAAPLLAWYDRRRRALPWRALPGERPDPYSVWLSEVMLQQTTVQAVKPYFEAFMLRWPHVEQLAAAPVEEIMKMWAGLGYYSRARNLHACAKAVVERFGGQFPATEADLLTLPGIGAYTAAAISAIAFDRRAVVVDGNVERVVARLFTVDALMPAAKGPIRRFADGLTPNKRPGDFAQAMMDLGATICTPRKPACGLCPFLGCCLGQKSGQPEAWPRKAPKAGKATRYGAAFVAIRADGALLVRTRPPKGLLGGMTEAPGTAWLASGLPADALDQAPFPANWERKPGIVRHVFTHFPLELTVFSAMVPAGTLAPAGMRWISANEIGGEAFPTVFRKVLAVATA
ncbi:MAG: A/G-specific adenine glycosylase [Methylocystis sp.]|nr:A/G-specific adenine glycosylase [Methylocystis sp.]MCA3584347.1 A/G-specific adenine glycosylase [Methylocystis sp.]MCA3589362.1 A/G-specific adenine glycosylase [Methylocystis sp.]MCA3592632.1 A/G-specific adenine glycosylase [Methylocystis sp.]